MLASPAGCSPGDGGPSGEKVTVLAAASTTNAIQEVAGRFEEAHPGITIEISTGPSNGLAQQILAGAPADVFLSANVKWAERVAEEGLAVEQVDLLRNRMVLIVPRGNPAGVSGPEDLESPRLTRLAIAGENVPAGIYAEQALAHLNLLDRLRTSGKLARGSDVRVTLVYVERGEAEAGVVYATDARISEQVEVVFEFDPDTYDAVIYPVVLLKRAAGRPAARSFFEFLREPGARQVFARHGFAPS